MTVSVDGQDTVLKRYDSCTIPSGQQRRIENCTNNICKMLVVIPYPESTAWWVGQSLGYLGRWRDTRCCASYRRQD